jgi:hypothetical protein
MFSKDPARARTVFNHNHQGVQEPAHKNTHSLGKSIKYSMHKTYNKENIGE